jgi:hypothetical protein
MPSNVLYLPKTRAQAARLKKLIRRDRLVDLSVTVLDDDDPYLVQRAWRVLFGLFQDCSSIPRSKGFKKRTGRAFKGKIRASMLEPFLNEAMAYHNSRRARIEVEGEKLRPRLLDVLAA